MEVDWWLRSAVVVKTTAADGGAAAVLPSSLDPWAAIAVLLWCSPWAVAELCAVVSCYRCCCCCCCERRRDFVSWAAPSYLHLLSPHPRSWPLVAQSSGECAWTELPRLRCLSSLRASRVTARWDASLRWASWRGGGCESSERQSEPSPRLSHWPCIKCSHRLPLALEKPLERRGRVRVPGHLHSRSNGHCQYYSCVPVSPSRIIVVRQFVHRSRHNIAPRALLQAASCPCVGGQVQWRRFNDERGEGGG